MDYIELYANSVQEISSMSHNIINQASYDVDHFKHYSCISGV